MRYRKQKARSKKSWIPTTTSRMLTMGSEKTGKKILAVDRGLGRSLSGPSHSS